ncbi:MAG: SdrD B-like domain-containing protein [Caldilineaceae bacterium]
MPNGVVLELLNGDGTATGRATTAINGYYLFSGLAPGNYRVRLAASNLPLAAPLRTINTAPALVKRSIPMQWRSK